MLSLILCRLPPVRRFLLLALAPPLLEFLGVGDEVDGGWLVGAIAAMRGHAVSSMRFTESTAPNAVGHHPSHERCRILPGFREHTPFVVPRKNLANGRGRRPGRVDTAGSHDKLSF